MGELISLGGLLGLLCSVPPEPNRPLPLLPAGLYGVGKAALHPPALAVLSHTPDGATQTVAWVGKGVVYDTGGLSIKGKVRCSGSRGAGDLGVGGRWPGFWELGVGCASGELGPGRESGPGSSSEGYSYVPRFRRGSGNKKSKNPARTQKKATEEIEAAKQNPQAARKQ